VKRLIAGLAFLIGSATAYSHPGKEVVKTCVKTESTSPHVKYVDIPVNEINETEDEDARRTETTIRFGQDEMGIWQTDSPSAFGLVYNGKQVSLAHVARLSREKPSQFDPSLARWGVVSEGAKSYICITFNFEGLGQSGSYQSVRGVYLLDRGAHRLRPFYTVGRVTAKDVVLAK
jgi:hypothetical protein